MAFVADVKPDQEGRNLLENARVFQLAAIDRAHARKLRSQATRYFIRIWVIAADDDIAVERFISIQQLSRKVVKSSCYAHAFGYKLGSLLR